MASLRRFTTADLFEYNEVNLDVLTETYNLPFYLQYLAQWPEYFQKVEGPGGLCVGYVMGKAEGRGTNWHGHVTAVTVAPEYRRQGLANMLMGLLEDITVHVHDGYFVDLYVRASNALARGMYEKLGYSDYRQVLNYYAGEEDALDMRKAMPRDREGLSVVPHDPFKITQWVSAARAAAPGGWRGLTRDPGLGNGLNDDATGPRALTPRCGSVRCRLRNAAGSAPRGPPPARRCSVTPRRRTPGTPAPRPPRP